ncbi:hypothetical protein HYH02_004312 [Chlamydomonas schloesseri]|uniref:Uncharacterized protein n=1 Tax=Chlamydomonas schloesseri TaxID=2026947 RepID=A0A836B8X9_9CHLO|nr:hypothetical protein HYH02_004312 [Chlamydomonas schloesseri]|eukprot:KAG2451043.1 hypothetical protein HYH02_004312 [Chlamydomonas schloesseri]
MTATSRTAAAGFALRAAVVAIAVLAACPPLALAVRPFQVAARVLGSDSSAQQQVTVVRRSMIGKPVQSCPIQPSAKCSGFFSTCAVFTCAKNTTTNGYDVTMSLTGAGCKGGT